MSKLPKNMFIDIIEPHKYYLDYVTINWEIPYNSGNSFSKPSATHFIHTISKTIKSEIQKISELYNHLNGINIIADGLHKHIRVQFSGSFFVHNIPNNKKHNNSNSSTNIIDDTKSLHKWFIYINDIIQQGFETYNISYLNCGECKHCTQLEWNTYQIEDIEELDYEYIKQIRKANRKEQKLFYHLPCKNSTKIYLMHYKAKPVATISRLDIATHLISPFGYFSFYMGKNQNKYPIVVGKKKKDMHVQPGVHFSTGEITALSIGKKDNEGKHSRKCNVYLRVYDKGWKKGPDINFQNRFNENHNNVIRKEWELHRGALKTQSINGHQVDNFFKLFKNKDHIRRAIKYIRINRDVILKNDTEFYKHLHDEKNEKIWGKNGLLKTTFKHYNKIIKDKAPLYTKKEPQHKWKEYYWNAFDNMIKPALMKKSTFDKLTPQNIKFITETLLNGFNKQTNEYKVLTERQLKIKKELDKLEKINQLFPN